MSPPLQAVILDPSEVAVAGRVEIPLEDEGISIFYEGVEWGTQEVKQFLSEGLFGSRPIDQEWPMRSVKLPLTIRPHGARSFDDMRVMLEQWVAMANLEGGWLKRVLPSGRYGFLDITEAKLHLSSDWLSENEDIDRGATLELQALPEFYGPVVTEVIGEGTGDVSGTIQVAGEIPARVEKMTVEDLSGNDQLGLMWHYRRRNYDAAATAEWAYDAETLGPLDIAEKVTLAGSYGTKVVEHPNLSTDWTPVLSTTFLTHTGLYDVWARVYTTSEKLPWLRLAYGVGDIVAPQENVQVQVPGKEAFYLVNLGQVNIRSLPFGAQRWEGVVQARGEFGGENISIDRVWFKCADECSGVLGALQSTTALTSILAGDNLEGSGALKGSEATRGGKWEPDTGGTEDFERSAEGAKRIHVSDSEGRSALLSGSTIGPVLVKCELETSEGVLGLKRGVYLRYFSSTFWVRVTALGFQSFNLEYEAGGGVVSTTLAGNRGDVNAVLVEAEINANAEVTVRAEGKTYRGSVPATFKEGEPHAEGKVGIFDYNPSSTARVRTYRYFAASALPLSDAVIYADKVAFLSSRGMFRQSKDGLGAGPVGHPGADLPRLPVSGSDEIPVEVAVKPSRGQFGDLADSGKDKVKVTVAYRPCYPSIPES